MLQSTGEFKASGHENYCPRQFCSFSRLQVYLALKDPASHYEVEDRITCIQEVMCSIQRIVIKDKLYDPRNYALILCDPIMASIFGGTVFHYEEVAKKLKEKLHKKIQYPAYPNIINPLQSTELAELVCTPKSIPPEQGVKQSEVNNHTLVTISNALKEVFDTVSNPNKIVFTYEEVKAYFYAYLKINTPRILNKTNPRIIMCEGDLLEKCFQINAFHASQTLQLINKELFLFLGQDKDISMS